MPACSHGSAAPAPASRLTGAITGKSALACQAVSEYPQRRVIGREGGGVDLLAVIGRQEAGQPAAELLERAPQPADPPVGLALVRQDREQVAPVSGHLGQEPGLAAAAEQVAHYGDGQQLGVAAGRRRSWPWRDGDGPGCDQVINEYVDVGEQVFGWQHGDGPGHVSYPIFPPSRHAHQVLAWLEPHLASSGSPSLQLLGQGGRCLGGIRDHAFASSRPGSGPCRCR